MRKIIEADAPPIELLEANPNIAKRESKGGALRVQAEPLELMPHQVRAVKMLGARWGLERRLIGDDMRVGKTPTAIQIDIEARECIPRKQRGNNCTLIVCPKSVLGVWPTMLYRMGIPWESIHVVDLPKKEVFKEKLAIADDWKQLKDAEAMYFVVNWSSLPLIEKQLVGAGPWFHVIGDEIHEIKDYSGRKAKSLYRIKAKQKTALSGTWTDDKAEDAFSPLHWLWPAEFSGFWAFARKYLTTSVNRKTGFEYVDGVNFRAIKQLHKKLEGRYIRRTFEDVAEYMPEFLEETHYVEMGKRQRQEYDQLVQKAKVNLEVAATWLFALLD